MDRNTPAITRVPYEILKEIVSYAYVYTSRSGEQHEFELDMQVVSPPILASHVCRSWRQSLLSDPGMWTCISIAQIKPAGIMEVLHRSQSASLYVFLDLRHCAELEDTYSTKTLVSLLKQIHRFKLLHVYLVSDDNSLFHHDTNGSCFGIDKVLECLKQPVPRLQTFGFWNDDMYLESLSFDELFAEQAPNLSRLHLRFLDIPKLHSPLFKNLSEFNVTLFNPNTRDDSLLHLLHLLEAMPQLKLLVVHSDSELQIVYTASPFKHEVALPHLERLVLEVNDSVDLLEFILEHVTFPENVKWHISSSHPYSHELSSSFSKLLSAACLTSLHIHFTSGKKVVLSLGKKCGAVAESSSQCDDDHKLVYNYSDSRELLNSLDSPSFVHSIVSKSCITHLALDFETHVDDEVFPTLFACVPDLVSMTIKSKTTFRRFSYYHESWLICLLALRLKKLDWDDELSEDSDYEYSLYQPKSRPTPAFPCPSLRELTVNLMSPLNVKHAFKLCKLSDKRREKGLPLQIFVRCPKVEDDADIILQIEGPSIHVSEIPAE